MLLSDPVVNAPVGLKTVVVDLLVRRFSGVMTSPSVVELAGYGVHSG